MPKKKSNKLVYILLILLAVAVVALLLMTTSGGIIINTALGRQDISLLFHQVIDQVNPNALQAASVSCYATGARYVETPLAIGCFDMPPGAFDSSNCLTNSALVYMQNVCTGINGARWICNTKDVGCHY